MAQPQITATLLFTILPNLDLSSLARRINARMPGLDLAPAQDGQAEPTRARQTSRLTSRQTSGLTSGKAEVTITTSPAPLGAEAFCGAITPDTPAATRAALIGIVGRHGGWVRFAIQATGPADPTDTAKTVRLQQRLAHACAAELARLHPPLALHWGPTNRLMQRAAFDPMVEDDAPIALFLAASDEITGQRRLPGLRIHGAQPWLGLDLHAQLGALPREVVRHAALAFVKAARASAAVVDGQSFHHAGQSFRIAHAADTDRIDLIPAAQTPLVAAPHPRALDMLRTRATA